MINPALTARIKANNKVVSVYKLKSGGYNLFLGTGITMEKVYRGDHRQTFKETELQIIAD